ncbi:hypothetical protein CVN68_03020 [Sphingomonas psychrotolerans]|uniref:Uncharacterized protein n=1 Tax=Sphingomonas psychrotolerans TaxID=1327635 RepID=A0A2K8MIS0_9SPHN|nr:hypothetical protein CVN68_03020 [Sphingomonas psychrotolerans]
MFAATFVLAAAPAAAAPWWYVGQSQDRVLFIDTDTMEREGDIVRFAAKEVIRQPGNPVARTVSFMEADCVRRRLGWGGVQRFGYDETVIDTSTRAKVEMAEATDALAQSELDFVCSKPAVRHAVGYFPLTIDDVAFTEALLAQRDGAMSPLALQERMAKDKAVPIVRSSAPAPATFGQVQTVGMGQPMVPPRDYSKGAEAPNPAAYDPIEAGRIYDIAYQGIKDGQMRFEIRGYSIDDLVNPGSGQIETAGLGERKVYIRDLAITVTKVSPDRITYSIALEKRSTP